MSKKGPKYPTRLQTLTCIRQVGTRRENDGTIHYSFVGEIHPNLPAVSMVLTVTPDLSLHIQAHFDEHARTDLHDIRAEHPDSVQLALLEVG